MFWLESRVNHMNKLGPLVIQSDFTVLAEVDNPDFKSGRSILMKCAELVKAPEHIHTYRLTPLSIWNMSASGVSVDFVLSELSRLSRYPIPRNVSAGLKDFATRYGLLRLKKTKEGLIALEAYSAEAAQLVEQIMIHGCFFLEALPIVPGRNGRWVVNSVQRGPLKLELIKQGFPVMDFAGFTEGETMPMTLRKKCTSGSRFGLRDYQKEAVDSFIAAGSVRGGAGVVVLPCGAGKTIVGMGCMAELQTSTLILTCA